MGAVGVAQSLEAETRGDGSLRDCRPLMASTDGKEIQAGWSFPRVVVAAGLGLGAP